jgi:hypothetical protein
MELEGGYRARGGIRGTGGSQAARVGLYARVGGIAGAASYRWVRRASKSTISGRHQLLLIRPICHCGFETRAPTQIKPPYLVVPLHIVVHAAKYPDLAAPNPTGMVIARNKFPATRPRPRLQIQETYIVQNAVVTSLTAADV